MTKKEIETRLRNFLNSISKDPVGYMRRHGYTGRKNKVNTCPLANCLKDRYPVHISVYEDCIGYTVKKTNISGMMDLPKKIKRFIEEFDAGDYPDLESNIVWSMGETHDTYNNVEIT